MRCMRQKKSRVTKSGKLEGRILTIQIDFVNARGEFIVTLREHMSSIFTNRFFFAVFRTCLTLTRFLSGDFIVSNEKNQRRVRPFKRSLGVVIMRVSYSVSIFIVFYTDFQFAVCDRAKNTGRVSSSTPKKKKINNSRTVLTPTVLLETMGSPRRGRYFTGKETFMLQIWTFLFERWSSPIVDNL